MKSTVVFAAALMGTVALAQTPASNDLYQCAKDCTDAYTKCQESTGPDGLSSNKAQCAAEYAKCLGYSPFTAAGGTLAPVSACQTSGAPAPAPTTPIYAPAPATNPQECAKECTDAYTKCQESTGPDGLSSNKAQCAAEYAKCLGYNPYTAPGGTLAPVSACQASGTPTPPAPAPVPSSGTVPPPNYPAPPSNSSIPPPPTQGTNGAATLTVSGTIVAAVFAILLL